MAGEGQRRLCFPQVISVNIYLYSLLATGGFGSMTGWVANRSLLTSQGVSLLIWRIQCHQDREPLLVRVQSAQIL